MRRIVWSNEARREFIDAVAYIARDDQAAARRMRGRIDAAVQGLSDRSTGRPGRVPGTHEKSVTGAPYIIAYAVDASTVTILRVVHGARDWPRGQWPE